MLFKNNLLIVLTFSLFLNLFAFAQNSDDTLDKIKLKRDKIHSKLNLNEIQQARKLEIDTLYYKELEPGFKKTSDCIEKINSLIENEQFSEADIDSIKQEFDEAENELFLIRKKYEKQFSDTLTFNQKVKYVLLKKQAQRELKKELKAEIKQLKS